MTNAEETPQKPEAIFSECNALLAPGDDLPDELLKELGRGYVEEHFCKNKASKVFAIDLKNIKRLPRTKKAQLAPISMPLRKLKMQLQNAELKVGTLKRRIDLLEANAAVERLPPGDSQ